MRNQKNKQDTLHIDIPKVLIPQILLQVKC